MPAFSTLYLGTFKKVERYMRLFWNQAEFHLRIWTISTPSYWQQSFQKKKNVCWWLCLIMWYRGECWQTSRCLKLGNVCASLVLEGYKLWLADMKDIWGSSQSNKNIILGYLARFPHFKIGWFRQTKNHGTEVICAFYRFQMSWAGRSKLAK